MCINCVRLFLLVIHCLVPCDKFINFYLFPVGHLSTARASVIVSFQSVGVFIFFLSVSP